MKATSLEANKKAETFKESHKKRILDVLTEPLNGLEISERTNLEYVSVMRRMSELETQGKVICVDRKDGKTVYEKRESNFKKSKKPLSKKDIQIQVLKQRIKFLETKLIE